MSIRPQNFINDLKNLENSLGFSNPSENQELFSSKIKKVAGAYKIKTPGNTWIDEFVVFRSKSHRFKGNDENTNNLKGISESQSKYILKLKNITIVYLDDNIKKIVIFILFVLWIMNYIFNK